MNLGSNPIFFSIPLLDCPMIPYCETNQPTYWLLSGRTLLIHRLLYLYICTCSRPQCRLMPKDLLAKFSSCPSLHLLANPYPPWSIPRKGRSAFCGTNSPSLCLLFHLQQTGESKPRDIRALPRAAGLANHTQFHCGGQSGSQFLSLTIPNYRCAIGLVIAVSLGPTQMPAIP